MLRFALFKEVLRRKKRRTKRKLNNGAATGTRQDDEEEGSGDESEEDEEEVAEDVRMDMPPAKQIPEEQDVPMDDVPAGLPEDGRINPERYAILVSLIRTIVFTNR